MEINAPVRGANVWRLEEQPGVSVASKNSLTQFPQEFWDGGAEFCHILGFFPLGENIQPPQSVPEHPKAFSIFIWGFLGFFSGWIL